MNGIGALGRQLTLNGHGSRKCCGNRGGWSMIRLTSFTMWERLRIILSRIRGAPFYKVGTGMWVNIHHDLVYLMAKRHAFIPVQVWQNFGVGFHPWLFFLAHISTQWERVWRKCIGATFSTTYLLTLYTQCPPNQHRILAFFPLVYWRWVLFLAPVIGAGGGRKIKTPSHTSFSVEFHVLEKCYSLYKAKYRKLKFYLSLWSGWQRGTIQCLNGTWNLCICY